MKKNIKKINNAEFNKQMKKIWRPGKFNPDGSYTGISYDYDREPVQDQDDL